MWQGATLRWDNIQRGKSTRHPPMRKLSTNGTAWPNLSLSFAAFLSPISRGHWSHQHHSSPSEPSFAAMHPCQMPLIAPSCSVGSQKSLLTPYSCSAALSTLNPLCRGGLVAEIRLPLPRAPCLLLALTLQLHCLSLHLQLSPTWKLTSVQKRYAEMPPAAPVPLTYVMLCLSLADHSLPSFLSCCCFISTSSLNLDSISRGIPTWMIWLR